MYLAFNHTSDIYQSLSQRGKTWFACFLHFHGFSISAFTIHALFRLLKEMIESTNMFVYDTFCFMNVRKKYFIILGRGSGIANIHRFIINNNSKTPRL